VYLPSMVEKNATVIQYSYFYASLKMPKGLLVLLLLPFRHFASLAILIVRPHTNNHSPRDQQRSANPPHARQLLAKQHHAQQRRAHKVGTGVDHVGLDGRGRGSQGACVQSPHCG
jgi:hypothetical protein